MSDHISLPKICPICGNHNPKRGKTCSNACRQKSYRIANGIQPAIEDVRFDPNTGEAFKPRSYKHKHVSTDSYKTTVNARVNSLAKRKAGEIHQAYEKSNAAALQTMRRIAFEAAGLEPVATEYRNDLRSSLTAEHQLRPVRSGTIHVETPTSTSRNADVAKYEWKRLRGAKAEIADMIRYFFHDNDINNLTAAEVLDDFCRQVFGMSVIQFVREASGYSKFRWLRLFKQFTAAISNKFVFTMAMHFDMSQHHNYLKCSATHAARYASMRRYPKKYLELERAIVDRWCNGGTTGGQVGGNKSRVIEKTMKP